MTVFRVPGHTPEDLAQERALARLTATPGHEGVAITLRLIDLLRQATRARQAALNTASPLPATDPAVTDDARLEARALVADLMRLPARQARAVILLAAGYSYREIADREGVTPKRIDKDLVAARKALA